jgi:GntR family transcriptional regulator, transcriptional repressor for pyruvate dehydrogenase complex
MAVFLGGFPPKYADRDTGIQLHTETLEALRSRDPGRVASATTHHLKDLEIVADLLERGQPNGEDPG